MGQTLAAWQLLDQHQLPPAPLIVVQGQDNMLNLQVRQFIRQQFSKDGLEFNLSSYDLQEEGALGALLDEATTLPFFGDERVVFVENPLLLTTKGTKIETTALLEYLQHPLDTTRLIFLAPYEKLDSRKKVVKTLLKQALLINTNAPEPKILLKVLEKDAQRLGANLTPNLLTYLVQRVAFSYGEAYQVLEQCSLYPKPITEQVIQAMVPQKIEASVFDLITAIYHGRLEQALALYHHLLAEGTEPIMILSLMIGQARLLLQVALLRQRGLQQGEIAARLTVHPYRIKLAYQMGQRFKSQQLAQFIMALIELDYQIKTGQLDKETALELQLIRLTAK